MDKTRVIMLMSVMVDNLIDTRMKIDALKKIYDAGGPVPKDLMDILNPKLGEVFDSIEIIILSRMQDILDPAQVRQDQIKAIFDAARDGLQEPSNDNPKVTGKKPH